MNAFVIAAILMLMSVVPCAIVVWRGTVSEATALPDPTAPSWTGRCVLVIGGAGKWVERWDEDVVRAEVQVLLQQGLGVKEVSRRLAAESGWARREVYRLALEER